MCGGMGMMGMGWAWAWHGQMGGGMGAMGIAAAAPVDVKNVDKGVTITFTSSDPARVKRLQKMAEAMRLMHEAERALTVATSREGRSTMTTMRAAVFRGKGRSDLARCRGRSRASAKRSSG